MVKVENLPEAPIAIAIDNDAIEENLKRGATVGNLIATDEDAGEKHTYKLIDNPEGEPTDNSKFTISGTRLRTAEPFDFDATPELTVYSGGHRPRQTDLLSSDQHHGEGCQ